MDRIKNKFKNNSFLSCISCLIKSLLLCVLCVFAVYNFTDKQRVSLEVQKQTAVWLFCYNYLRKISKFTI